VGPVRVSPTAVLISDADGCFSLEVTAQEGEPGELPEFPVFPVFPVFPEEWEAVVVVVALAELPEVVALLDGVLGPELEQAARPTAANSVTMMAVARMCVSLAQLEYRVSSVMAGHRQERDDRSS
jgi:hypothetical protein